MLHQVADHRFDFAGMVARPGLLVDEPVIAMVHCCWKRWWTPTDFVEPATGLPTGSARDGPPGRGRMDRENHKHGQTIKDIYVYLLVSDARQRLCGDPTRRGTWR